MTFGQSVDFWIAQVLVGLMWIGIIIGGALLIACIQVYVIDRIRGKK